MLSDHCEFFLTVLWQEVECIERVCEISFLDVLFLGHPRGEPAQIPPCHPLWIGSSREYYWNEGMLVRLPIGLDLGLVSPTSPTPS